jgi:hypothetical protein
VSGQLHALVSYPHGKIVRNPMDRKTCGPQNLAERCRGLTKKKKKKKKDEEEEEERDDRI